MATAARLVYCQLQTSSKNDFSRREGAMSVNPAAVAVPKMVKLQQQNEVCSDKILLQPRLCTLRSYGSDPPVGGMVRTRKESCDEVSPFFETLSEYIESSKKSHDFEIISGRLAMVIFAATLAEEAATGTSVLRKMDVQGISEAGAACLAAVGFAAVFAWVSSARFRVDRMFTVGCNSLIDSLIDQIVDGLFYEGELSDWSDDI